MRKIPEALAVVVVVLASLTAYALMLGAIISLVALFLLGLWNFVGADLFSAPKISFAQALFISVVIMVLGGGIRRN